MRSLPNLFWRRSGATRPRATRVGRRLLVAAALAASVSATLAGCGQGGDVARRPPIGQVVKEYDATVAALRDVVSDEYPDATWIEDGVPSRSAGRNDSVSVQSSIWYADAPLADDESARDRLVKRADSVVRAHGFDNFSAIQRKPGDFAYVTGDRWGGELHFSGGVTVTIRYTTGQHPEG